MRLRGWTTAAGTGQSLLTRTTQWLRLHARKSTSVSSHAAASVVLHLQAQRMFRSVATSTGRSRFSRAILRERSRLTSPVDSPRTTHYQLGTTRIGIWGRSRMQARLSRRAAIVVSRIAKRIVRRIRHSRRQSWRCISALICTCSPMRLKEGSQVSMSASTLRRRNRSSTIIAQGTHR